MGRHNPFELISFHRFACGLVQGHCSPNHLNGLQDVLLGGFANGEDFFGLLRNIFNSKGEQLVPAVVKLAKSLSKILLSRRASFDFF
jgi:hypothetical protein